MRSLKKEKLVLKVNPPFFRFSSIEYSKIPSSHLTARRMNMDVNVEKTGIINIKNIKWFLLEQSEGRCLKSNSSPWQISVSQIGGFDGCPDEIWFTRNVSSILLFRPWVVVLPTVFRFWKKAERKKIFWMNLLHVNPFLKKLKLLPFLNPWLELHITLVATAY